MELLPVIIGISALVLFALFVKSKLEIPSVKETKEPKEYAYIGKTSLLTNHERDFYKELTRVVEGRYALFAQVHLSSILNEKINGQNWKAARARIERKSVDFLLCDPESLVPKLAIELDDYTHSRPDRIKRDRQVEQVLQEAGIPLLRTTNAQDLEAKIDSILNSRGV